MGNSSSTQFAAPDGEAGDPPRAECHLVGNPDIFGLGIRLSYYVQYAAAIVAIIFYRRDEVKVLRLGLTAIALALFIALCIGSTGDSLIILDWTTVMAMNIFFPLYLVGPVFIPSAILIFEFIHNAADLFAVSLDRARWRRHHDGFQRHYVDITYHYCLAHAENTESPKPRECRRMKALADAILAAATPEKRAFWDEGNWTLLEEPLKQLQDCRRKPPSDGDDPPSGYSQ